MFTHLFQKMKEKKIRRWLESTLYAAEHRTLPQAYFEGFHVETKQTDAESIMALARFLVYRTFSQELSDKIIDRTAYKFDQTDNFIRIICDNPEKYTISNAPLAYAIYMAVNSKRYIVKEYDVTMGVVWCEWTADWKHICYQSTPEIQMYPDDAIAEMILNDDERLITAMVYDHGKRK